jgi:hypothetical protein
MVFIYLFILGLKIVMCQDLWPKNNEVDQEKCGDYISIIQKKIPSSFFDITQHI